MIEFDLRPVTLTGTHVQLEPLTEAHLDPLWAIGQHESLWRYIPATMDTRDDFIAAMRFMMQGVETGSGLGFAQRDRASNEIAGGTTFLNVDSKHRRVEIGFTWLAPKWQRTALNTEAKLLLLAHAFETLGCIRVEFKTDSLNDASRMALTRIGATEEGIFRNHMIMPDGRFRHSAYYSITVEDWPRIKSGLQRKLQR